MNRVVSLLLIFTLLVPVSALADEPPDRPELPPWQVCYVDNVRMACYDLEGTKRLLEFEDYARKLHEINLNQEQQLAIYREVVKEKDEQLDIISKTNHSLVEAYSAQTEELMKQVAEKNKYKYQPRFDLGPGLGWIIAGGVLLLSGGVVLGLYVD
jgi:hypothetical protein